MRKAIVVAFLAACGHDGYYVANVYQDATGKLSVQKCAISSADKPEPYDCFNEAVAAPPTGTAR
jgi:hypothetical protein